MVCSDVSKNGSKLLLTMAPNGQADIYELNLATNAKTRVTKFNGIDVNGKYVDDESRMIFVSNRLGYANTDGSVILYIKHRGSGSSIGYVNLTSQQSLLFPLGGRKIQSIDW